jgi:hypothetical protein
LYIANGHATRALTRDYETEFWLHDIYVGNSKENPVTETYFQEKLRRSQELGMSYGGYEKNRFFINEGGTNFTEVAWLFGVALEEDCRNVVGADVSGDGKTDLIVTTFETHPKVRQTVKVFENRLDQLPRKANAAQAPVVTGDSYRSQVR